MDVPRIGLIAIVAWEGGRFLLEKAIDHFGDRLVESIGEKTTEIIKSSSLTDRVVRPIYYKTFYRLVKNDFIGRMLISDKVERAWILGSFKDNVPLIIKRSHANNIYCWPNWAFNATLLRDEVTIKNLGLGEWILHVKFPSSGVSIYNNEGRRYIKEKFLNSNPKGYNEISKWFSEFVNHIAYERSLGTTFEKSFYLRKTPLRWVAGGVIPIVYWKKRLWIAFPYRDIPPVGLNHFGGISQDTEEMLRPRLMVLREFLEEFMVVDRKPAPNSVLRRKKILAMDEFQDALEVNKHFLRLQSEHARLRKEQDGIKLVNSENKIQMHSIDSVFNVEIELEDGSVKRVPDSYFSIDPYELGIEIDFMYWLALDDNDYILFGEPDSTNSFLIRSPIVLISLEAIVDSIKTNNLVSWDSKECRECKSLKQLSGDDYYVFDIDHVELRMNRIKNLVDTLNNNLIDLDSVTDAIEGFYKGDQDAAPILKDALSQLSTSNPVERELSFHLSVALKTWPMFLKLREKEDLKYDSPQGGILRMCPVTWKVLTMATKSCALDRFNSSC